MLANIKKAIPSPSINKKLGIDPDSELAAKLRANQIRTMISTTPLMMIVITAIALIMVWILQGRPGTDYLYHWAGLLCLVSTVGYLSSRKRHLGPLVHSASRNAPRKVARGVFILGAIWGVLPAFLYPEGDFVTKITLVAVIGGILGGGAMSMYVVPRALFTFLAPVSLGIAIGLVRTGEFHDYAIVALLACYTIALMRAGWTLALTYAESVVTSLSLNEKTETISLLLKDFSESASDWLWQTNEEGQLVHGAPEFAEHLGTVPECFCSGAQPPADYVKVKGAREVREKWINRESFTDLHVSARSRDRDLWVSISGKPLYDSKGEFAGYRGVASSITSNKEAEERIAFLAHNDALTGLVNRTHFSRAISSHIAKAKPDAFWAVMFLDLDGFKLVNDSKGHGVGDQVLETVAQRIKKQCSEQDVVARLGGDEFAILFRTGGSIQALSTRAEKLIETVSAPYNLKDNQAMYGIGVSIGIAIGGRDGLNEQQLLHNADLALYRAKTEGKGTYRFFEVEMDEIVRERRLLEQDLRDAVAGRQLGLCFQPLVSAQSRQTVGFEALVRWYHPERGLIPPSDFIPIAESMGLISDIGDWVLLEACRNAVNWPDHLFVAVNLSPQQFQRHRIIGSVSRAIVDSGLSPDRLELEVTEGLLMENTEEVTYALRELKGMGISIALDDFGTGYSSLSYLLKFPFDKLKIDRSFISSIETDEVARNVLEAIARLGNVLDLKVTAEGVETSDQLKALTSFNCTHFQGFLFGKPLTPADLAAHMLSETANQIALANKELAGKSAGSEDSTIRSA